MNIELKAVLSKIGIMKAIFDNHPATVEEWNDRNWLHSCLVLIKRIIELEERMTAITDIAADKVDD